MLRFAPSPTADMDIANLRVAILNYLGAQQKGEQFLVRIDDTDTQRNIEGKDTEIMMILEKFALKHDTVFHQSEHLNLHQTLALRLLKEKKAFVCRCIDEEHCSGHCEQLSDEDYEKLQKSDEKFVIRIKKPETNNDTIILGIDRKPTPNFASACADMLSNITFIIRDEKYKSDTLKQIEIKNLLGYESETTYLHLPTLLNESEDSSVKWLFEQGFIPNAILNYLILLSNKEAPKEIFTLPEAMEWFDVEKISKSAVKFDIDKLRHINREHLKQIDDKQLSTLFGFADADIGKLAKLYLEECATINELEAKIRPIFAPKDFEGKYGKEMGIIAKIIFDAPAFESYKKFIEHIIRNSGLKENELLKPLRYLLTAAGDGPELSDIYPFIKSYILEVAS